MRLPLAVPATVLTAALGLALLGGTAAGAATSSGQELYLIDNTGTTLQLRLVDTATAASTPAGAIVTPGGSTNAYQPAVHPVTGVTYLSVDNGGQYQLHTVDITTGAISSGIRFESATSPGTFPAVFSLAIALDGIAYAVGSGGAAYTVNLTDAKLTPLGTFASAFFSLTTHPVTGDLWAIDQVTMDVLRAPAGTTTFVDVGDLILPALTDPYALQIDRDGTFWLATDSAGSGNRLYRFTASTSATPTLVGPFAPSFSLSLILGPAPAAPAPALADTGAATSGQSLGLGIAAGILALLGATLLVVRKRSLTT